MSLSPINENKTLSKIDSDLFYRTYLENLHEEETKRVKKLKVQGVLHSTIEGEVKNKFIEFKRIHFKEVLIDGWIESFSDPFAYHVVQQFEQLVKNKEANSIQVLISKLDEIRMNVRNLRLWSSDELINLPNIEVIKFIALYTFLKETTQQYDAFETFPKWQDQNRVEARIFISSENHETFELTAVQNVLSKTI